MPTISFRPTAGFAKEYPPVPAKEIIPEWIKNVKPHTDNGTATVKRCPPMIDMVTSGYYIRSFGNFEFHRYIQNGEEEINITGDVDLLVPFDNPTPDIVLSKTFAPLMTSHNFEEAPLVVNDIRKSVFKFLGYWTAKTPPGYSILYLPVAHFYNDFQILSAIVDADDDWEIPTAFTAFCNYHDENEHKWSIKAGDPIALAIPFLRDEWDHEILEQDDSIPRTKTNYNYRENFHKKKSFK
jgi:hypothetical protein